MNRQSRPELLIAPLFLAGLVCLLLNDLYLKHEFSNALTGKLSDFAGLLIFPYFFSTFRPNRRIVLYGVSAVIFIFWKLPLSQELIDFCNSYGIEIGRVVDYSDFLALVILPFSYQYFGSQLKKPSRVERPVSLLLSVVSIFSFCATTLPREGVDVHIDTDQSFVLDLSKADLFKVLEELYRSNNPSQDTLTDSLYYLYFDIPNLRADVTALAVIHEVDSGRVIIHLDSIIDISIEGNLFVGMDSDKVHQINSFKAKDFEKLFESYYIGQIKKKTIGGNLYYNRKRMVDEYE